MIISQRNPRESKCAILPFFFFNKKFKLYTALRGPLTNRCWLSKEAISLPFFKRLCLISRRCSGQHGAQGPQLADGDVGLACRPLPGAVTQVYGARAPDTCKVYECVGSGGRVGWGHVCIHRDQPGHSQKPREDPKASGHECGRKWLVTIMETALGASRRPPSLLCPSGSLLLSATLHPSRGFCPGPAYMPTQWQCQGKSLPCWRGLWCS